MRGDATARARRMVLGWGLVALLSLACAGRSPRPWIAPAPCTVELTALPDLPLGTEEVGDVRVDCRGAAHCRERLRDAACRHGGQVLYRVGSDRTSAWAKVGRRMTASMLPGSFNRRDGEPTPLSQEWRSDVLGPPERPAQ